MKKIIGLILFAAVFSVAANPVEAYDGAKINKQTDVESTFSQPELVKTYHIEYVNMESDFTVSCRITTVDELNMLVYGETSLNGWPVGAVVSAKNCLPEHSNYALAYSLEYRFYGPPHQSSSLVIEEDTKRHIPWLSHPNKMC